MRRSRFTEEQIIGILKEHEAVMLQVIHAFHKEKYSIFFAPVRKERAINPLRFYFHTLHATIMER